MRQFPARGDVVRGFELRCDLGVEREVFGKPLRRSGIAPEGYDIGRRGQGHYFPRSLRCALRSSTSLGP